MDNLINNTLNSLNESKSPNMASLKATFKLFLEGLRTVSIENNLLKEELEQKSVKISTLETQVKSLLDEKNEVAKSLDFNADAIKNCENYVTKIEGLEKNLEEADACKNLLKNKITSLENKIDDMDAYERRDCVVLSGAVPTLTPNENIKEVTVEIIKTKYRNLNICPEDISICHRMKPKPATNGSQKSPNIFIKFVRRDKKRELIMASKGQAREAQNKLFANESLTPNRTSILQTLLKIKRGNDTIKGVTTEDGKVFAFTAHPDGTSRSSDENGRRKDRRHAINTKEELQTFCDSFLRKTLEDLLESRQTTPQD